MNRMRAQIVNAVAAAAFGLGCLFASPAAAAPPAPTGAGDIPKVDTAGMTPSERAAFQRLLEKFPSACGKSHSLLTSLRSDPTCKRSEIVARWVAKALNDGLLESEVEEKYASRFGNTKCYEIDTTGAASKGDPKAPITIVEFSDFQCPHCKDAAPVLKQLLAEFPQVRLVFMNYPISAMHPQAANAAAAAIAAGKQDKFWAYHDKLFENQANLSPAELLRFAQELKLDVKKFQTDMEAARARVKAERAQGEKADLQATPSIYVNCRKVENSNIETLRSHIQWELAK